MVVKHYALDSGSFTRRVHYQPIVEFCMLETVSTNTFPYSLLTLDNFSASLVGLETRDVTGSGLYAPAYLYHLKNEEADGIITQGDYDSFDEDDPLRRMWTELPDSDSSLNSVDVTRALRDTLRMGYWATHVGFILNAGYLNSWDNYEVQFAENEVRLVINIIPTQTPVPTATPTPQPGMTLRLSRNNLKCDDNFKLDAIMALPQGTQGMVSAIILLNLYGRWFYYPDWTTDFAYKNHFITNTTKEICVLDFIWPETTTSMENAFFSGAVLTTDLSQILGQVDTVYFGWN